MSELLIQIRDAIVNYELSSIEGLVKKALDIGISAKEILNEGLSKGMDAIGIKFKDGDVFVPEVLMASKTMSAGVEILKPLLVNSGDDSNKGTVIIGTVKGDLHDIGKKLVAMLIEGAGYKVYDLGVDVPAEKFINETKKLNADYVCMSAMLTTTMTQMKTVIDELKEQNLYDKVHVLIGGAPVSEQYAEMIGAQYSHDAASAVELVKGLSSK